MWPFKKKKEEKPKYDISNEDRFGVIVRKDKNEYCVEVRDWWSRMLFAEEKGKKKDTVICRTATIQDVKDYKTVLNTIEKMKDILRKKFIKERKIQCKPKKKKKSKNKKEQDICKNTK